MHESLRAGKPVPSRNWKPWPTRSAAASACTNRYTFAMCRDLLDDVVLLSEEEIADGIRHAFATEGETVEGAGAVGIAALLGEQGGRSADPAVVLVSGRNIDEAQHRRIVERRDSDPSLPPEDTA